MMKKIVLAACLAAAMLLLTGCLQVDVETGIDNDYSAYLAYNVQIVPHDGTSTQRLALVEDLKRLKAYYEDQPGLAVESSQLLAVSDGYVFKIEKRVQANSYEEAFDLWQEMVTDESLTLFMQAETAFVPQEYQLLFSVAATADVPKIIELGNVAELKYSARQSLEATLEDCTGSITVTLPATSVALGDDAELLPGGLASLTVPLDFSGETKLALQTRLDLDENGRPATGPGPLGSLETRRMVLWAGAGAGLLLAAIGFVLWRRGKKRAASAKSAPDMNQPQYWE